MNTYSNDNDIKQVIVMRKDLNMRKGKMVAQGAHASLGVVLKYQNKKNIIFNHCFEIWHYNGCKKICVYVETENDLRDIHNKAISMNMPSCLIIDAGHTEFHGKSTPTCVCIGPAPSHIVDEVTGDLKLL